MHLGRAVACLFATSCAELGDRTAMGSAFVAGFGARDGAGSGWSDVDRMSTLIVGGRVAEPEKLVGIEFGFLAARGSSTLGGGDPDVHVDEFYVGVTRSYPLGSSPFWFDFGVGAVYARATLADSSLPLSTGDDDEQFGGYARIGLFWSVLQDLALGVDARLVQSGEFELDGEDLSGTSGQALIELRVGL